MKKALIVTIVGIIAGILDLIPLIMVGAPLYNMLSIIAFWLSASFFTYKLQLFNNGLLNGLLIALVLMFPMALAVSASNPKDFFPMLFMALILGPAVGWSLKKWK